jgi:hypothetical protein
MAAETLMTAELGHKATHTRIRVARQVKSDLHPQRSEVIGTSSIPTVCHPLGHQSYQHICVDRQDSSQIPEEVMFERTVAPQSRCRRCCVERHIEQEFQTISRTAW